MKMKYIILILLSLGTISLIAGDNLIDYLKAKSDGKTITVEWKSIDETDIKSYAIERAGNDQIFKEVEIRQAKGFASAYSYADETAFKLGGDDEKITNNVYYYRIGIIKKDNSKEYSTPASVTHNTSSIRRTWGMLKEMFR